MSTGNEYPLIVFVWRPDDRISTVLETSQKVGSRAILDLTSSDQKSEAEALLRHADLAGTAHVKISPEWLTVPWLADFLDRAGIESLWVELNPVLLLHHAKDYLDRLVQLSAQSNCYPIVGDLDVIGLIVHEYPGLENIVIKGSEAAGFVSSESIFALFSAVRHMVKTHGRPRNLIVWGGVATPEAAAAFLAVGCKGIVFESIHWLTDLCAVDRTTRAKISSLHPEHTDLVGLNLNVPCRLFNKGNSLAVKDLKAYANSLCEEEIRDEDRRRIAEKIRQNSVHPLCSSFSKEELIPLGVEAAFAQSFVRRFGASSEEAIDGFLREIERLCRLAPTKEKVFTDSWIAREMGTKYALIQGAMSCITDSPQFALKVSETGGLPTIALGSMPRSMLEDKLGNLRATMGGRPFAVNVIALDENPHRNEQMEWILCERPNFAVIAAGDPSHARQLLENGIEVIYVAPNERLMELAFSAGVRYVVCEGSEAGGHIGEYSTLTLAQIVLDWKDRDPVFFDDRRVILAGGICDRETAFMAAMLGADAIQAGTYYLTTTEIVATGALTPLYQRMVLEAHPGSTVVTGQGTGLRVRSLRTQKIEEICSRELDFAAGPGNEASFRRGIEQLSAGSLFIAAKGLDESDGSSLAEEICAEQGQFMSGACAGVLSQVSTLAQLHFELAEASLPQGIPFWGPIRELSARRGTVDREVPFTALTETQRRAYRSADRERVAITGMSVINSLGKSPEEVWANSIALKSGVVRIPPSKWNHELYYDPRPGIPEKTYSNMAAFQEIEISRNDLGISPQDFHTMAKSTKITLWLAQRAIEASGILRSEIPRHRIAVLISQNAAEAASTLTSSLIRAAAVEIIGSVQTVISMTPEVRQAAEEAIRSGRAAIDDTSLMGRLNSAAAGFICNKYGFQGPSFAVTAACATALVAIFNAYQLIRNGIIDAAVVGGAEEPLTPFHFLNFSALRALAGLSGIDRLPHQASRPFDAERDGMVLGEGGGVIVIERESMASKRGAKVHAYITGMGASSNNFGMLESSRATQEMAIGASFDDASYGPDKVDVVECHATGTTQGDVEEVMALQHFFNTGRLTVLTSFKSQIGHTLGASGVNGLIRGIMAMNAGIFPPTLNYENPDPAINLERSGFAVIPEPADWNLRDGLVRRLQINAFGFGGPNYIVQLEKVADSEDVILVSSAEAVEMHQKSSVGVPLPNGVHFFRTSIGAGSYRVGVVADTTTEAVSLIEKAEGLAHGEAISSGDLRTLAKAGVYLGEEGASTLPLAFAFPGQGSQYQGMGSDLYETFPVIREWMDRAAHVAEFDLLGIMFRGSQEDLQNTRWQQPALFTMEYALAQHLISLGVRPAALAGHSLGQGTALCLAGVYSFEDGFRLVNKRAECMDKASRMQADPGVMMAVDAPLEYLEERIAKTDDVYITNVNSPRQVVLGGNTEAVRTLGERLKKEGYRGTFLRVSMAFHSPTMQCVHDELAEFMADLDFHPPEMPVISNTTMQPFPADTFEIKKILLAHLESPVYWMQNVKTLWHDYRIRLFVEVGPGSVLNGLILDTLEEADCIHTCFRDHENGAYMKALAQLFAKGHLPVSAGHTTMTFSDSAQVTAPRVFESQNVAAPEPRNMVKGIEETDSVVLNQIRDFVRHSLGHYVKPALLEAIRREHNRNYSEGELDAALDAIFPGIDADSLPSPRLRGAGEQESIPRPTLSPNTDELTEAVIRIVMDATGYERNEIEPSMDLKEDLSIRSSRLPVLVDKTERYFGIQIHLKDFSDVRTVADFANKLRGIVSLDKLKETPPTRKPTSELTIAGSYDGPSPQGDRGPVRRLVCREVSLQEKPARTIHLTGQDSVVVFTMGNGTESGSEVLAAFVKDRNDRHLRFGSLDEVEGGSGFDLRQMESATRAADRLTEVRSLAGIVLVVDDLLSVKLKGIDEVSKLLCGLFVVLKAFLNSSAKKFATLIHQLVGPDEMGSLLYEGVQGMFLSLTHEYPSVQFRSVQTYEHTDWSEVADVALDRNQPVLEVILRNGKLLTREWQPALSSFTEDRPAAERGDVVILSGGAGGITYRLACILAPLGCRLIFLGRTTLVPDNDRTQLLSDVIPQGDRQTPSSLKSIEIVQNVEELRSAGVDATYYACDVSDAVRTKRVFAEILQRYGRIDGIVHGAGILRDALVERMSPEDFSAVVDVKLRGAWNLLSAARNAGLKFFVCLSSVTAIMGNPGQVNYAAGNRAMSGLVSQLRSKIPSLMCKSLMLPPIEGVGMAEDPEIRKLMQKVHAGYVHAEELAALFGRELTMGTDDAWVLFMRSLPRSQTTLLDSSTFRSGNREIESGTALFPRDRFPMIDSITKVDLVKGELHAAKVFSLDKDVWLEDHKPFAFVKHQLVSAIMVIEAFMEAARMLYPHLSVHAIREIEFLDILECPRGIERHSEILCRRIPSSAGEIVCEVSLAGREISPTGRVIDRTSLNYKSLVILGHGTGFSSVDSRVFPVRKEELDGRPMSRETMLKSYRDSLHKGRYRVLESVDGTGPDAIRARLVYREGEDFAPPLQTYYQYSPYLLEALMQMCGNFYIEMRRNHLKRQLVAAGKSVDRHESIERKRNKLSRGSRLTGNRTFTKAVRPVFRYEQPLKDSGKVIPYRIGEILFSRKCVNGESILLEGRISDRNEEGFVWTARGVDKEGQTVMLVRDMVLRWISA